uniref:Putative ovule protein n=1 Tax=Solanum chacoense TaxID=4108 RepID=A0A0V0GSS5_SOLCH
MSFPEILRKQREDQDKMMAEMISGANYRHNQQLSYLIAASSLNNQAINQQFNQTLMSYGGSAGAGAGQGQIPNLYQNTMGADLFNTGAAFAGLGLNALFGNLKF